MGEKIIGLGWQIIAFCLPQSLWHRLIRSRFKAFIKAVEAEVTDRFLELLLNGMKLGFILIPGYRRNLYGWSGTLVFCTREKRIEATTHFKNGRMYVDETIVSKSNSTVVFKDGAALRSFLFSKDQDIFNSLLANTVEVEGNLNYVCKFGFMAKDLLHRLGIAR
jgi:hypothetical protein